VTRAKRARRENGFLFSATRLYKPMPRYLKSLETPLKARKTP
jgi:hypothetical protein